MAVLDELKAATDPGQMFLIAWEAALKMAPSLSLASKIDDTCRAAFADALAHDEGAFAVAQSVATISAHWPTGSTTAARRGQAGLLLELMRAVDQAMASIHPRSKLLPPSFAPPAATEWVIEAGERRTALGAYAETEDAFLVPRGPFARSARGRYHEGGFSLPDQFAFLGRGIRRINYDAGVVEIVVQVVDQGIARGVPARKGSEGSERVTFVPLAEAAADLKHTIGDIDGNPVIDVMLGSAFEPMTPFTKAARAAAASDMLVAPELTTSADSVSMLADALANGPSPRLVVAGSGRMPAGADEPPANETVVLNALGATLWRHRKVWAYGMNKDTFERLDLKGLPDTQQLMEHITCGDRLTIADVDGLGRCLVLICQDLMIGPLGEVVRSWQPDWVFVPILDCGTDTGRWSSFRARNLAAEFQGHFLVSSSLTMVHWLKNKPRSPEAQPMAVAFGPIRPGAGQATCSEVRVACESPDIRHGTVQWLGIKGWQISKAT